MLKWLPVCPVDVLVFVSPEFSPLCLPPPFSGMDIDAARVTALVKALKVNTSVQVINLSSEWCL